MGRSYKYCRKSYPHLNAYLIYKNKARIYNLYMKTIMTIIILIAIVDFIGFTAWSLSRQKPLDGFFVGCITTSIIEYVKTI